MASFFQSEDRGGTLLVALDRPPLNALTCELLEEGTRLLADLARTPPPAGLVLTGTGKAYTAGVDTKVAASLDPERRARLSRSVNTFAAALYRLPCAVVSAVNGHAIGAGGIMCLASDWTVIADAPLRIGLPEAKAGLPFPAVPTLIMDYQLDPVWRRRLALSSLLLGPQQAVAAGLADEVADPQTLIDTAVARACELDSQAAFRQIKADQRRKALAELDAMLAMG
jgi:enoyl-CoA hydratase/carnithine racemase